MNTFVKFRNAFLKGTGKSRKVRIAIIALLIAVPWCAIDFFFRGGITINLWHDLIVLILAVAIEHILPWGKNKNKVFESNN